MTSPAETVHTIGTWDLAREAYRSKYLRQALFDGSVVMDDVLINLHGEEHRDRRRIENPLFRRDVQLEYERTQFPAVLAETLDPYVERGKCELMNFAHRAMLNLSCINAGLDRTSEQAETERLLELLSEFIEGARIRHYQGDLEAKVEEITVAVTAFEAEFVEPSRLRRVDLVARGDDLPPDVLSRLVANTDLDPSAMAREVAFYLTAGASTSAVALTNTFDNLFRRYSDQPAELGRLAEDPAMVRRCIHESLRLSPISPIGGRRATADFVLSDGTRILAGERVDIDIRSANRDREVFGPTADEFDPDRPLPDGVPLHGFSFGHGMHHCIGAELAGGVDPEPADGFDQRLLGLVGVVVQELLKIGVWLDPDDPPEIEDTTARRAFRRFPVLIG